MQACTSAHYPREQSVRLTHTFAHERIAQLYIPLRELRFLARSAFLCDREFQRNFLLHKKNRTKNYTRGGVPLHAAKHQNS